MAGFFGKMKNTGVKAKLQGECTLLDREMKARKIKFGIELYDLIRDQEKASGGSAASSVMSVMGVKTKSSKSKAGGSSGSMAAPGSFKKGIKDEWELVRTDISALEEKQEAMRVEKTHEEVRRERGTPAVSAKEKVQNAGGYLSSATKETKLLAQIALIDRDIKKRKEQFGIDVYEKACEVTGKASTGFKSGVKNAVRGGLMKISEHEQKIQLCVENAMRDIGTMERSRQTRIREIDVLDEDGAITFRKSNRAEV